MRKDQYQLNAEQNLGYTGTELNGTYGVDTLALPGRPGVVTTSLNNQVVASIITSRFYVGLLGINAAPIVYPTPPNSPSLLSSLKSQNLIPSLSFGYTAGAFYSRLPRHRQLVLDTDAARRRAIRCQWLFDVRWLR